MIAKSIVSIAGILLLHYAALSQEKKDTVKTRTIEEVNKEKQNPVGGLRSVFLQDIIAPIGEGNGNAFSVQPVWPFRIGKKVVLNTYTIIPYQSLPPLYKGGSTASGLGNITFNGFFRPADEGKGPWVWGAGPCFQLPTRTNEALGSSQLSVGPAGLIYYNSAAFSGGLVAQNFWSLGGSGANKVNTFSAQYIFYYNFPHAWYVESNGTITANWLSAAGNVWLVPLGGGPGKTFQVGKSKRFYSAAIQGFYNVARPEIVGTWSVIAQFQFIF
jgi:hypothetical protein